MSDYREHEIELRWYYTAAATACGLKSSGGAWELMARLGVMLDGGTKWMDGGPEERDLESFRRARLVWQRLNVIGPELSRVLELQFGDASSMGRVSLALVASLPAVASDHAEAAKAAEKHLREKGVKRPKDSIVDLTTRGWVLLLAAKDNPSVAEYLREASLWLDAALAAYAGNSKASLAASGKIGGKKPPGYVPAKPSARIAPEPHQAAPDSVMVCIRCGTVHTDWLGVEDCSKCGSEELSLRDVEDAWMGEVES